MSFWTGGPSTGPNPANLIEWVEQQAVRLPVPPKVPAAGQGVAHLATFQASAAETPQESSTKPNPQLSLANAKLRVYDIATLYALRKEAGRRNMELKVHTTALKGEQPARLLCLSFFLSLLAIRGYTSLRTSYLEENFIANSKVFDDLFLPT